MKNSTKCMVKKILMDTIIGQLVIGINFVIIIIVVLGQSTKIKTITLFPNFTVVKMPDLLLLSFFFMFHFFCSGEFQPRASKLNYVQLFYHCIIFV